MNIQKKIVLLGLAILVILVGARYLTRASGNGEEESSMVEHAHRVNVPPDFSTLKNPIPLTDESVMRGREIYLENCSRCHGFSGRGNGPDPIGLPVMVRDLTDKERMSDHTDGDHFYWITYGVGKEKLMPPFGGKLTERWDLVNYVKTLYQDSNI
ncbi:MAG: c-type cytochrome [Candidatus Brocadiales bacterium]